MCRPPDASSPSPAIGRRPRKDVNARALSKREKEDRIIEKEHNLESGWPTLPDSCQIATHNKNGGTIRANDESFFNALGMADIRARFSPAVVEGSKSSSMYGSQGNWTSSPIQDLLYPSLWADSDQMSVWPANVAAPESCSITDGPQQSNVEQTSQNTELVDVFSGDPQCSIDSLQAGQHMSGVRKEIPSTLEENSKDNSVNSASYCNNRAPAKVPSISTTALATDKDTDNEGSPGPIISEKRRKRMLSNRISAQRSRQRRQERLDTLEVLVAQLRVEIAALTRKFNNAVKIAKQLEEENKVLKAKLQMHVPDRGRDNGCLYRVGSAVETSCSMVCQSEGVKTDPDEANDQSKEKTIMAASKNPKAEATRSASLPSPPNANMVDIFEDSPITGQQAWDVIPELGCSSITRSLVTSTGKNQAVISTSDCEGDKSVLNSFRSQLLEMDSLDFDMFPFEPDRKIFDSLEDELWYDTYTECLP